MTDYFELGYFAIGFVVACVTGAIVRSASDDECPVFIWVPAAGLLGCIIGMLWPIVVVMLIIAGCGSVIHRIATGRK